MDLHLITDLQEQHAWILEAPLNVRDDECCIGGERVAVDLGVHIQAGGPPFAVLISVSDPDGQRVPGAPPFRF